MIRLSWVSCVLVLLVGTASCDGSVSPPDADGRDASRQRDLEPAGAAPSRATVLDALGLRGTPPPERIEPAIRALAERIEERGPGRVGPTASPRPVRAGEPTRVFDLAHVHLSIGAPAEGQHGGWLRLELAAGDTVAIVEASADCEHRSIGSPRERARCEATREHPPLVLRLVDLDGRMGPFATSCPIDASREACVTAPHAGTWFVTLHQGLEGAGLVRGFVEAAGSRTPFETSGTAPIALPKSVALDVETVLWPDPENVSNDGFGLDASELLLLDGSLAMVAVDVRQSGVGAAARQGHAEAAGARFAVPRPWSFRRDAPPALLGQAPREARTLGRLDAEGHVGPGRLRVVLNDRYVADADRDGLSDEVEGELGTCDGAHYVWLPSGAACPVLPERGAIDPRDTDADGLTDAAETLGVDGPAWQDSEATPASDWNATLPRWGARPLGRDVFIEIDSGPHPSVGCPADATFPEPSASLDPPLVVSIVDLAFFTRDVLRAVDAPNADGTTGIEAHFDVNLGAVDRPAHGRMRRADPTAPAGLAESAPGTLFILPHRGSRCVTTEADVEPSPVHRGLFRWAAVAPTSSGGGRAHFAGRVNSALNTSFIHELGHHLGLSHGGPMEVSPMRAPAGDRDSPYKLVHDSTMSYHGRAVDFVSFADLATTPFPTLDGLYHESEAGRGFALSHLDSSRSSYAFEIHWSGAEASVDLDRDGDVTGAVTVPVIDPGPGGFAWSAPERALWYPHLVGAYTADRPVDGLCVSASDCPRSAAFLDGPAVGVATPEGIEIIARTDSGVRSHVIRGFTDDCRFRDDRCSSGSPGSVPVHVDGVALAPVGVWAPAATRFGAERVALAWTVAQPGSPMPSGLTRLASAEQPRLAISTASPALQTLRSVALPAIAGGTDGVAMVSLGERVGLVVRAFETGRLHWITCAADTCDPAFVALSGSTGPLISVIRPALALRRDARGERAILALGAPGGGALTMIHFVAVDADGTVGDAGLPPAAGFARTSTSMAFANQRDADPSNDRLLLSTEVPSLDPARPFVGTRLLSTRPGMAAWGWAEVPRDAPPSRALRGQDWGGAVATFFEGDLPSLPSRLRDRVHLAYVTDAGRGDAMAPTQPSTLRMFLVGAGEAAGPEHEYEEDSTLSWGLCAALGWENARDAGGAPTGTLALHRAPDLATGSPGLACPALDPRAAIWNRLVPHLFPMLCASAPGAAGCGELWFDPDECLPCRFEAALDELLRDPAWYAIEPKIPSSLETTPPTACPEPLPGDELVP